MTSTGRSEVCIPFFKVVSDLLTSASSPELSHAVF